MILSENGESKQNISLPLCVGVCRCFCVLRCAFVCVCVAVSNIQSAFCKHDAWPLLFGHRYVANSHHTASFSRSSKPRADATGGRSKRRFQGGKRARK